MIAETMDRKDADMNCHTVPPPDYNAGEHASLRIRRTGILHDGTAQHLSVHISGTNPQTFEDFLQLNAAIWSQFTSDCLLWASLWLSKDHEGFKRVAVNKSFLRTLIFIESVQR